MIADSHWVVARRVRFHAIAIRGQNALHFMHTRTTARLLRGLAYNGNI